MKAQVTQAIWKNMSRLAILVLVWLAVFPSLNAKAQIISVQFLNGKNGKAIKKGVRIWAYYNNDSGKRIIELHTDQDGEIHFDSNGAKTFQVSPVGYIPCGEQPVGSSARDYAVSDVLTTGLLTMNNCGYMGAEPIRGRLLYFVKPASWWELYKN